MSDLPREAAELSREDALGIVIKHGLSNISFDHEEYLVTAIQAAHRAGAQDEFQRGVEAGKESVFRHLEGKCPECAGCAVHRRIAEAAQSQPAAAAAMREACAKHYGVSEKAGPDDPSWLISRGVCVCGEARSDGVTPYNKIWAAHIRAIPLPQDTEKFLFRFLEEVINQDEDYFDTNKELVKPTVASVLAALRGEDAHGS